MTNPDKSSGGDRGRNRGPKPYSCEPYGLNSASRSVSRSSNASGFSELSDSSVTRGKRRRETSPPAGFNALLGDGQSHIGATPVSGVANAFGIPDQPSSHLPTSPQHTTPRPTPLVQHPSLPSPIPPIPPLPPSRSWADDVDTPYNLGEDFRGKIQERFHKGYYTPEAGGGKGTIVQQYLERAFEALNDAVIPYLEDIGTRAEDIDGDILAIIRSTERFLEMARGWQKARAGPGFGMDTDEPVNPPNPPSNSIDADFTKKIDQLFKTIGNLGNQVQGTIRGLESKVDKAISGVHNLNNRVGQLEKPATQHPQTSNLSPSVPTSIPDPTPGVTQAPHASSTTRTFAQIVTAAPSPPQGSQNGSSKKANDSPKNGGPPSNNKSKTLRFVFRFEGGGLPPDQRLPPFVLKQRITNVMKMHDCFSRTVLLMVVWNAYGNLILEFAPGANPQHILQAGDQFKAALKFPSQCTFSRATNWSKVMLSHVFTGFISVVGDGAVFSPERILDEFKSSNRDFADLVFMQQPSWVKAPSTINTQKSSISFAFEDADGTKLQKLLKAQLYMFGARVYARKWNSKPLLRCCLKCHDYNHDGHRCNKPAHCLHCGGAHPTESHREKCSLCNPRQGKGVPVPFGTPCPHPKRCRACDVKDGMEGHAFNDPDCPKKAQYRVPTFNALLTDPSGRNQEMSDE